MYILCNPFVFKFVALNKNSRIVELLAPAANVEVAMAAVDAGADAVYMGGPAFGARVRAGNTLQDLEKAVRYAHRYAARCFLTLNTLVYEDQMPQALRLARQAYEMGVDALLIQDLGLIEAGLPPIELHASTQCHITTPQKAQFLESLGFTRLVLGRELSVEEISRIADSVQAQIETFVHGALCVSYSGQCYMSCYMNGRSGNRGECAQSCRLPYDLQNERGETLQKGRYLLSMKDLNVASCLEDLVDAGVDSLKIEGRLKDAVYVKNITAYYRHRLDDILNKRPHLHRPSQGKTIGGAIPDLEKSYHREYTAFNLNGKRGDWAVFDTPKAIGARVGKILSVEKHQPGRYSGLVLRVLPDSSIVFSKGDGLCFYGENGKLCGQNLENFEKRGNTVLLTMPGMEDDSELPRAGAVLFRNRDTAFENAWRQAKMSRKIEVDIKIDTDSLGVVMRDDYGHSAEACIEEGRAQGAKRADTAEAMLKGSFSKLGDTAYQARKVEVSGKNAVFVPVAVLNECRRQLVAAMDKMREDAYKPLQPATFCPGEVLPYPELNGGVADYRANAANSYAERFYRRHGAASVQKAFELLPAQEKQKPGQLLMECKHCIRHQLGQCLKKKPQAAYAGNLYLCYGRHKFALHFDCGHCRMEVRTC